MQEEASKPMFNHVPGYSWWVLICSMIVFMCFFIGYNGASVMGPVIQEDLGISATELSMITTTIPFIPYTFFPLIFANAMMKLGVKKWVILTQAFNLVSGLLLFLPWFSDSYVGFAVTRFIQGCTGMMNGAVGAQLAIHFTKNMRGFATGIFMGFLGVGFSVTAFVVPRVYETGVTWAQAIGIVTVAAALIGTALYTFGVTEFHKKYGEQYDSMDDLTPPVPETVRSTRFDNEFKPANMKEALSCGRFWAAGIFGATTAVVIYTQGYALPLFLSMDIGMDIVAAGNIVGSTFIWKLFASPAGGLLSDRVFKGERFQTNMIGTILCGAIMLIMLFVAGGQNVEMLTALAIIAFFFGSMYGGTYWTWNYEMSQPEFAPGAAMFFVFTGNLGGLIGTPVCGMLIDATGTGAAGMIFIAVVALLGAIPAYLAKN